MKRATILLLLLLAGCWAPYIPPQPVPPPTPDPVVPSELTRASFAHISIGGDPAQLATLPQPTATARVGARTIYTWALSERRPDGSGQFVMWEVHVEAGKIVASHAW